MTREQAEAKARKMAHEVYITANKCGEEEVAQVIARHLLESPPPTGEMPPIKRYSMGFDNCEEEVVPSEWPTGEWVKYEDVAAYLKLKGSEEKMRDGVALIAAERERQVSKEGWTPEHDDGHRQSELAMAAACYALPAHMRKLETREDRMGVDDWMESRGRPLVARREVPEHWPAAWLTDYKPEPNDRIRELVKAGALIAAEIDRLNRLTPTDK